MTFATVVVGAAAAKVVVAELGRHGGGTPAIAAPATAQPTDWSWESFPAPAVPVATGVGGNSPAAPAGTPASTGGQAPAQPSPQPGPPSTA
ncbi:MAG TPA: hypothetical protein VJT31_11900, partial [Rugosimonospora sp.]|nr:hypothetical protein [Rugosimonospora sp.]